MIPEPSNAESSSPSWISLIDYCPHCKRELTGHSYSLLACDVIEKKGVQGHLIDFFESLKKHDWPKVLTFQRWEGLSDNVELYGILCGSDSVALAVVKNPFEIYDNPEILLIELLSKSDSAGLLAAATGSIWKPI